MGILRVIATLLLLLLCSAMLAVGGSLTLSTNQSFRGFDPNEGGIFEFETFSGRFEGLFDDQTLSIVRNLHTFGDGLRPTGLFQISDSGGETSFGVSAQVRAGALLLFTSNLADPNETEAEGSLVLEIEGFFSDVVIAASLDRIDSGNARLVLRVSGSFAGDVLQEVDTIIENARLFASPTHRLSLTVGGNSVSGGMRFDEIDREGAQLPGVCVVPDLVKIVNAEWRDNNGFTLEWESKKGQMFGVFRSFDLSPGSWEQIAKKIPATIRTAAFTDQSPGVREAYYRVIREVTTRELIE